MACEVDDNTLGWSLTGTAGTAGTNPAENFVGTTDNQVFELRDNLRALRLEPRATSATSHRTCRVR